MLSETEQVCSVSNCTLAGTLHLADQLAYEKCFYRVNVIELQYRELGFPEMLSPGLIKIKYGFNSFNFFEAKTKRKDLTLKKTSLSPWHIMNYGSPVSFPLCLFFFVKRC